MRVCLSVLLLLVQLGPLAAAGLCMRASPEPVQDCAMPMADMPQPQDHPRSSAPQDCARMAICTPVTPNVQPAVVQLVASSLPTHANFSAPVSLFAGDPVAPPQPPPIV